MENPELLVLLGGEDRAAASPSVSAFIVPKNQRLKAKELKLFAESLSRLLEGGIPILRALEGLEASCGNPRFEKFLKQVREDVQQGTGFSNALESTRAVPGYFSQIVYAGEISGTVARVLAELAGYLEKEEALKSRIREAVAYPALILLMGFTTLGVLLEVVIPKLAVVYKDFGAELPFITRIILGLSGLFFPVLILLLIITASAVWLFLKKKETLNILFYKLPVSGGFFRSCVLIQFSRLLSLLLESGIPVLEAMNLVEKTFSSAFLKADISRLRQELQDGGGFSSGLKNIGWMDPLSKMLASAGVESGRLPASFAQIARDSQVQFESRLQMAIKVLEPGLILVIGLIVGFIVIGTVLPIFDISGLMK